MDDSNINNGICLDAKLLALHTVIICLTRSLVLSGHLDREIFHSQLDNGSKWLHKINDQHSVQAFESLLPMLKDI